MIKETTPKKYSDITNSPGQNRSRSVISLLSTPSEAREVSSSPAGDNHGDPQEATNYEDCVFYKWTGKDGYCVAWVTQKGGLASQEEFDGNAKTLYMQPSITLEGNPTTVMLRLMAETDLRTASKFVLKHWFEDKVCYCISIKRAS